MKTLITEQQIDGAINTIAKQRTSKGLLNQVLNLKVRKDFRWFAAYLKLDAFNFEIYRVLTGEPASQVKEHAITTKDLSSMEDIIRDYAFEKTEFGRKQNIHRGVNVLSTTPSIGTTSSRYSRRCTYTRYDYHANYLFLPSRTTSQVMYSYPGLAKPVTVDLGHVYDKACELYYILFKSPRYKGHTRVSSLRFKLNIFTWNEDEKAFMYRNESYHVGKRLWIEDKDIEKFKASIIAAYRYRRSLKIEQNKKIESEAKFMQIAQKTYVEYEDSIQSGNCEHESRKFLDLYKQKNNINNDNFAVNGAYLLSLRDDNYTRRAVVQAAKKRGLL